MQTVCQHCQAKGKIDDAWQGKKIKCPRCGQIFVAEPVPVTDQPKTAAPPAQLVPPPPMPARPSGAKPCSQCQRPTPENELVDFDGILVCAGCKAVYVQKLREGVRDQDLQLQFAGFWIRVGAKFIDGIITGLVSGMVGFGVGMLLFQVNAGEFVVAVLNQLLGWGIGMTYATWFVGRFGATPGKMALGLKIVKPDGESLTYLQAFGRFWAEMLSGIIMGIGYLMVAFDEEKRALHDRVCATRVVRAR